MKDATYIFHVIPRVRHRNRLQLSKEEFNSGYNRKFLALLFSKIQVHMKIEYMFLNKMNNRTGLPSNFPSDPLFADAVAKFQNKY